MHADKPLELSLICVQHRDWQCSFYCSRDSINHHLTGSMTWKFDQSRGTSFPQLLSMYLLLPTTERWRIAPNACKESWYKNLWHPRVRSERKMHFDVVMYVWFGHPRPFYKNYMAKNQLSAHMLLVISSSASVARKPWSFRRKHVTLRANPSTCIPL